MPSAVFLLFLWVWDAIFIGDIWTAELQSLGLVGAMAFFYWALAFGMELIGVYDPRR
jgi:hypothetical protein